MRELWRCVRVPGSQKLQNDGLARSGAGCFKLHPYGNSGRRRIHAPIREFWWLNHTGVWFLSPWSDCWSLSPCGWCSWVDECNWMWSRQSSCGPALVSVYISCRFHQSFSVVNGNSIHRASVVRDLEFGLTVVCQCRRTSPRSSPAAVLYCVSFTASVIQSAASRSSDC